MFYIPVVRVSTGGAIGFFIGTYALGTNAVLTGTGEFRVTDGTLDVASRVTVTPAHFVLADGEQSVGRIPDGGGVSVSGGVAKAGPERIAIVVVAGHREVVPAAARARAASSRSNASSGRFATSRPYFGGLFDKGIGQRRTQDSLTAFKKWTSQIEDSRCPQDFTWAGGAQ